MLALLVLGAGPGELVAHEEGRRAYVPLEFAQDWGRPGPHPDRIVLNLTGDPARSISVTWRTDSSVTAAYAEIAPATAAPRFWRNAATLSASTQRMDASQVLTAEVVSHYHAVTFTDLEPSTLYAYRVGDGRIWSEWIHFRTAADGPTPFSFLYLGDAQNNIFELWSRLIREGYRKAPDASFILHAGDLVNDAHSENEWAQWFSAGGFIHRMLPTLPVAGNHEYEPYTAADVVEDIERLSVQWKPQFTLPTNGVDVLDETNYYVDYQGARLIVLNSNEYLPEQAAWLRRVLGENPNRWTIVSYHHPLFSASKNRDNAELRALWKPVFDEYGVDIALQGHDHVYARGQATYSGANVTSGLNTRDGTGTVYVVSVSGGKMNRLSTDTRNVPKIEQARSAENTQLFQVISIAGNTLTFRAHTATGALYDAFDLVKPDDGGPNQLVDRASSALQTRRFANTVAYQDDLPEPIRATITKRHPGFAFDKIFFVDEGDFRGYRIELERGEAEVEIHVSEDGEILGESLKLD